MSHDSPRKTEMPVPTEAKNGLARAKEFFEVIAYVCAIVFFLFQAFIVGQFNYSMKVGLSTERIAFSEQEDRVALTVKLERTDMGRLQLQRVHIEVWDAEPSTPQKIGEFEGPVTRFKERSFADLDRHSTENTYLPPGDATQLAYFIPVPKGKPVILDATIVAKRTYVPIRSWMPEWRASCAVPPIAEPKHSAASGRD